MKKLIIAALVALVLAQSSWAVMGLGVFGSYWDTQDQDDAYGGGVKLEWEMVPPFLGIEVRGSYYYDLGLDETPGFPRTTDLDVVPVEAGLIARIPLVDRMLFIHGGGGAGYYLMDGTTEIVGTTIDDDIDDEWGAYAVGGVELALTEHWMLFGEGQYRWLEIDMIDPPDAATESTQKLDGWIVNAGLMTRW